MSAEIPTGYRLPLVDEVTWELPDETNEATKDLVAADMASPFTSIGDAVLSVRAATYQRERPTIASRSIYSTGYFYPMHRDGAIQQPAAGTWATDTGYLSSWATDSAVRIDRIGFRVITAGAAGSTADIAIYRDNGRARGRELVHSVTAISVSTTGTKNQTVAWEIPAGVYWTEVTFHGTVSALVVEAIPIGGGHFVSPLSASGTVPLSAALATGLSRPSQTTVPTEITTTETLAAAQYIPRLWFRPTVVSTPGNARWHDSDTANAGMRNYKQVVTDEHIFIENDPVLGDVRPVMRFRTEETDTELTSNPRTQIATHPSVAIGSEFWVGFALYVPTDFPATWNNSYFFTVAEMYATPFGGTSPFRFTVVQGGGGISLCATRTTAFSAGTANVWVKPLADIRGKWIDIILHGVLSTDPGTGYYELYTNEGAGIVQQQLDGQNTLFGASVVAGINDGGPNEHHLKNYRQAGSPESVTTLYFANHRVGASLEEVNPHSYA